MSIHYFFQHIIWFWQRRIWGFDERVIWNLDTEIAKWLVPRLKYFRKKVTGYPDGMTPEMWDTVIGKMIFALEVEVKKDGDAEYALGLMCNAWDDPHSQKRWSRIARKQKEGFYYLGKFFNHLWN